MPSSGSYAQFVKDQLSAPGNISLRKMMGEYLVYYRGKLVGGIYDDRFLVKPVPGAEALLPGAPREQPYPGAKEMLLVENIENRPLLEALIEALYEELPEKKR